MKGYVCENFSLSCFTCTYITLIHYVFSGNLGSYCPSDNTKSAARVWYWVTVLFIFTMQCLYIGTLEVF